MKPISLVTILLAIVAFALAACDTVSNVNVGSANPTAVADQQSAAAFLPVINGYRVTNADSVSDAITAAAGEGADALGNPAVAGAVQQIDRFIQCYQNVGAVSANIYTPTDLSGVLSGNGVPTAGAVAVVNQDRLRENLIACTIGSAADTRGFSTQSVSTCQSSGSFSSGGDRFTYIYFSTAQPFCDSVEAHFGTFGS